jgi:hypothetical protein
VPKTIATVVSARMATLHELDTVYGPRDLWWMLEINTIDRHNQNVVDTQETKQ